MKISSKGNVRNTTEDFRGHSEMTIDRKSVKVVQQATRNILSEHPIKHISFFQLYEIICSEKKKRSEVFIGEELFSMKIFKVKYKESQLRFYLLSRYFLYSDI